MVEVTEYFSEKKLPMRETGRAGLQLSVVASANRRHSPDPAEDTPGDTDSS